MPARDGNDPGQFVDRARVETAQQMIDYVSNITAGGVYDESNSAFSSNTHLGHQGSRQ
jgi:hypothetical protein